MARGSEDSMVAGWHLKREVQLGHIITTTTVLFSVLWWAGKLEQRLALLEQAQTQITAAQAERDARQDRVTTEAMQALREQLLRIDAKLDKIIIDGAATRK